jgi:LysM repeat protein
MASKTNSLHFSVSLLAFISVVFFLAAPAAANLEDHIIKTESGFYYTVQKGDTLWGLSKQFTDSPWDWPALWSNNPQIKNPHLIYPGQKLLIFKKGWEGKEKKEEIREPVVLSAIEPAAPVQATNPKFYSSYGIDAVGFIRKEPMPSSARIFNTWNKYDLISSEEELFVYPSSGSTPMTVGDKFLTYRTIGPLMDKDTNAKIGYQHYIGGIARITKLEPEYAVAVVEQTFHEIKLYDSLMPYKPGPTEVPIKDGLKGIVGKIIKPEENRDLVGENDIIFFDKGSEDGIELGQSYTIYEQEIIVAPIKRNLRTLAPEYVGKLIVLRTEANASSARILNSLKDIEPGYLVGNLEP